jgi:Flp pilus assembly protein TadD
MGEAEECLRKVVFLDSLNPNGWSNLGVVLLETGRYSEAVRALEKALELDPGRAATMGVLCGALVGMENPEAAIPWGEASVAADPGDAAALNNLGRAYLETGRFQESAAAFEAAMRRDPSMASPRFNLAMIHVVAGNPEPALALLLETVSIAPDYPGARAQLAVVYGMMDSLEESERQARMALEQDAADLVAMNCLALSLQGRGLREEAMEVYKAMLPMVADSAARSALLSRMDGGAAI